MNKLFNRIISSFLVFSLTVGMVVTSNTLDVFAAENNKNSLQYKFTDEDIESLEPIFKAIEEIPEDMLMTATSSEFREYFLSKGVRLNVYNDNIGETEKDIAIIRPRTNWWKCSLAIGQLIVTVGIPATKLGKIKNYIAALGGVKQTAMLLVGATTVTEKLQGTLTALGGILMTLTGIDGIRDHCFN